MLLIQPARVAEQPEAGSPVLAPEPPAGPDTSGVEGVPWERKRELGLATALVESTGQVLLSPGQFFSRMAGSEGMGSLLAYAVVVGWAALLVDTFYLFIFQLIAGSRALSAWVGGSEMEKLFPWAAGPAGLATRLLLGPFALAVVTLLRAGIFHLCLLVVGGAGRGFQITLGVVAYATAADLLVRPSPKKVITLLIPEDPPSFNPLVADTGYDSLVLEMVLLGLTDIDPSGNIFPELAVELPTLDNGGVIVDEYAGTMSVTWKMRNDVQWQDGTPVTADDAIFTWEAAAHPDSGLWIPGSDYIDSVEKIDQYSFVINYNTIYPGYLTQFGGEKVALWPAHYCEIEQGFASWDCGRKPLSNGPFVLTEWVEGDHMTFDRNANFLLQYRHVTTESTGKSTDSWNSGL